jgi:hypothetical protein
MSTYPEDIQRQLQETLFAEPQIQYLDFSKVSYIARHFDTFSLRYYCNIYSIGINIFPEKQNLMLGDIWHCIEGLNPVIIADEKNQIMAILNASNILAVSNNCVVFNDQSKLVVKEMLASAKLLIISKNN